MVAEGASFAFVETALYVGVFIVGISIVAFFVKKAVDSTKLHMDREHMAGYQKVEKAEEHFHYGGHSVSPSESHSAGHPGPHSGRRQ